MKVKNKIKLAKILTTLGISAVFAGAVYSVTNAVNASNNSSNTSITNKKEKTSDPILNEKSPKFKPTPRAVFQPVEGLFVNVAGTLSNVYIDAISDWSTGNGATIVNLAKAEINQKTNWSQNNIPQGLTLTIDSARPLIKEYLNPRLNIKTPALRFKAKMGSTNIPDIIISIIGTKIINGPTFPIDLMANPSIVSDQNNTKASFVYTPSTQSNTKTAPTPEQIKQFLFGSDKKISSLFCNLPNVADASVFNDGQFSISANDVTIVDQNRIEAADQYNIYNYSLSLNSYFSKSGQDLTITTNQPREFNLAVYVPKIYQDENTAESTYIDNMLNISSISTDPNLFPNDKPSPKTAIDFDKIRRTENERFKRIIIKLLQNQANSVGLPTDLLPNEIDVAPKALQGQETINNNLGLAVYNVVIKRVKLDGTVVTDENNWLNVDVVIGGFEKVQQTLFANKVSIASYPNISSKFASEFYNQDQQNDIISQMIKEQVLPLVYYGGSHSSKSDSKVSQIFKTATASYDLSAARFDDRNGTIRNVKATLTGYYDKEFLYQDSTAKAINISFDIVGFTRQEDASSQTILKTIFAPEAYVNYPAQSFLVDANQLQNGYIPETPADITQEFMNTRKAVLNQLIRENVSNLPAIQGNEEANWQYKEIKIDNFAGVVTGKVKFPYLYTLLPNGDIVIQNNNNIPSNQEPIWLDFSVEGFNPIQSATTATDLKTNSIIEVGSFGSLIERPANEVTLENFNPNNDNQINMNNVLYWSEQKDAIFKNPWDTFSEQLTNDRVGIQIKSAIKSKATNTYTIIFTTCLFNSAGEFKRSDDISIQISDFNQDDLKQKPTYIVNLPINIPPKFRDFSSKDIENIINLATPVNGYTKEQMTADLSLAINANYVKNIRNDKQPVYEFKSATPINDEPGKLKVTIKFVNNYYDENGNFVENGPVANAPEVERTLIGFKVVGSTELSPVISLPAAEFGQIIPSEAVEIIDQNSLNNPNIEKIKQIILDNLYSPVSNTDIPKEQIISYIIPPNINDQTYPADSSVVRENNGSIYFGSINDIEGSINLKLKFNANKWYENNSLQTQDKVFTVKLIGFKHLDVQNLQWFNDSIELDTRNLTSSVGDELASNLVGIPQETNTTSSVYYKTLSQVWSKLFTESGLEIQQNIDGSASGSMDMNAVFPHFKMNTEQAKCIVENSSGQIIMTFSMWGDKVFDPNTGLFYKKESNPYEFQVCLSGFINVKPTTIEPNKVVNLSGLSNYTAPSSVDAVFNHIATIDNYTRITSDTLPPGWSVDFDRNARDYSYIPTNAQDGTPNIIVDYANGSVTIKEFVVNYYFNKQFNLVKGTQPFAGELDWPAIHQIAPDALIAQNLTFNGFKKMAETTINSVVEFDNLQDILPHDYLFVNDVKLTGEELGRKLIFNNGNNPTDPNKVNNLSKFFTNYDNSDITKSPTFTISNIEEDNINGTISFNLQLVSNYFKPHDHGVTFVAANEPWKTQKVIVKGFKKVPATRIVSSPNISTMVNDIDDQLAEQRKDLFYYNVVQGFNSEAEIQTERKNRLILLIRDYYKNFITNALDFEQFSSSNPEEIINNYLDINNITTNFKDGTISFDLVLYTYVGVDGIIHRADKQKPLTNAVKIIGFGSKPITAPNSITSDNKLEINITHFASLQNLDYFFNIDDLKVALIKSASENGAESNVLNKLFRNIPPAEIFRFLSGPKPQIDNNQAVDLTLLTGVEIMNLDPASQVGSNNPTRTGTLKLKNVLIQKLVGNTQETQIGDLEIPFVMTGFAANVKTTVMTEWNLSMFPGARPQDFDTSKLVNNQVSNELAQFFNQEVVVNGINKPLWTAFFTNPVYAKGGTGNTTLTFKVIENNPSTGSVSVELTYQNYYSENGQKQTGTQTANIIIKGFRIQAATSIKSSDITLVHTDNALKVLPSEVNDDENKKNLLLQKINNDAYLSEIFSNPVLGQQKNTTINSLTIERFDDEQGYVLISIDYTNFYNSQGIFTEIATHSSTNIKISGFNKFSPTQKSKVKISLNEFFGASANIPMIEVGQDRIRIDQLMPRQLKTLIENEILKDNPSGDIGIMYKWVKKICKPVYQSNEDETQLSFTTVGKNQTAIAKVFKPGQKYEFSNAQNKYIESTGPNSTQNLEELRTNIKIPANWNDTKASKEKVNLDDVFIFDDRLGEIKFKLCYSNYWGRKLEGDPNNPSIRMDTIINEDQKTCQSFELTINGFVQDIQTPTTLSNVAIIATGVGAGVIILIILIAFLIWLWKFGIGSH